MIDFGKAFTFIFDDERWFDKLIVPILVSLIPVVGGLAFTGYILRTIKNVIQNEVNPLPDFEFGEDLSRGFRLFLIGLVYSLPIMLVVGLALIPMLRLNSNESLSALAVIFLVLAFLLMIAYSLFLMLIQPIMTANFAVKDTFASGFELGLFFKRLGNNFVAWLIVYAGIFLAGIISPVGSILFFVGVLITTAYSQLMVAHLTGQAYAASES
ncbi:MAG: DUF4013 domain-containing protein [Anaerolineaceae bacterium]|jgi:hypothetical protein|nr:DUF4013 domain-containing protein [Anaerolineaceae bacterium]